MHCFNTILHNKDFKSNLFWLNWREPQACLFLSIYQCSSSTGISLKVTVSDNTQVPFCHRIHSENAAQYPFLSNCAKLCKYYFGLLLEKYTWIQNLMKHGEMGEWGLLKQPGCLWHLYSSPHLDTRRFILVLWNNTPSNPLQSCILMLHVYRDRGRKGWERFGRGQPSHFSISLQ